MVANVIASHGNHACCTGHVVDGAVARTLRPNSTSIGIVVDPIVVVEVNKLRIAVEVYAFAVLPFYKYA